MSKKLQCLGETRIFFHIQQELAAAVEAEKTKHARKMFASFHETNHHIIHIPVRVERLQRIHELLVLFPEMVHCNTELDEVIGVHWTLVLVQIVEINAETHDVFRNTAFEQRRPQIVGVGRGRHMPARLRAHLNWIGVQTTALASFRLHGIRFYVPENSVQKGVRTWPLLHRENRKGVQV